MEVSKGIFVFKETLQDPGGWAQIKIAFCSQQSINIKANEFLEEMFTPPV